MKIQVTEEDIKCGSMGVATRCAVARAIKRTLNVGHGVAVVPSHYDEAGYVELTDTLGVGATKHFISFWTPGKRIRIPISTEVDQFALAFDDGESVQPLEFELTYTEPEVHLTK